ncbi:virulence protein RhuM/Fic/DOC family protein [Thiovibrio frasassiensis]|uniref:Virulence protein RhuM/Fic/DOC family protein n=1 Tax=Thiovibrio frasassiensis TaxID=2984131 RepID=A0A9X4RN84_9BACT|nr:virulence protein RhuM/Fic/DOC family protein [Thiovibrio frasassiensis]MDG4476975.1 virulence protein RhuM/Fic/DOC family protein [Thiovibrio frasassiensis]
MKEQHQPEQGEIIIYQSDDGQASFEVHLAEETVWLTLTQMAELFARDKSVISRHLGTIFSSGELQREGTVAKNATVQIEGNREVTRHVDWYNLDVIISVGYRVNSKRGVRFRQWASRVLKQHLIQGYTANERRLAEKGLAEMKETLALLTRTLARHETLSEEGKAVLEVVGRYAKSWSLLLQYDEDRLELPKERHPSRQPLDYEQTRKSIRALKDDLLARGEASQLFGQERDQHLQGILGNLDQTFGGQDLYGSVEEKAAHLLYFVIKDHPFSDGNKRIGSFLFLLFLRENSLLEQSGFNDNALVALALLVAESDPKQKDLLIRLILNLLTGKKGEPTKDVA